MTISISRKKICLPWFPGGGGHFLRDRFFYNLKSTEVFIQDLDLPNKKNNSPPCHPEQEMFKAIFTLYRIGFCSVSKLAPIQCEQELMFCCGAEIVPKRSLCEHKPYPSYNLQRSLLISKGHLPVRGSVAISAPIKCSDLTRTVSKTYPIRNVPLSTGSGAVLFRSRNCFESGVPSMNRSPIRYIFCDAPFHYAVQCEHSLRNDERTVLLKYVH